MGPKNQNLKLYFYNMVTLLQYGEFRATTTCELKFFQMISLLQVLPTYQISPTIYIYWRNE